MIPRIASGGPSETLDQIDMELKVGLEIDVEAVVETDVGLAGAVIIRRMLLRNNANRIMQFIYFLFLFILHIKCAKLKLTTMQVFCLLHAVGARSFSLFLCMSSKRIKVIGFFERGFIIYNLEGAINMTDQHAAHERIRLELLLAYNHGDRKDSFQQFPNELSMADLLFLSKKTAHTLEEFKVRACKGVYCH